MEYIRKYKVFKFSSCFFMSQKHNQQDEEKESSETSLLETSRISIVDNTISKKK